MHRFAAGFMTGLVAGVGVAAIAVLWLRPTTTPLLTSAQGVEAESSSPHASGEGAPRTPAPAGGVGSRVSALPTTREHERPTRLAPMSC